MEYRSPLGYNFKLQQSLSACKEEKETPKRSEHVASSDSGRKFFDVDRRNSGGSRSSPARHRHSSSWNSPNYRNSQHNDSSSVEQYYHPSMLENPWEELEKNLKESH